MRVAVPVVPALGTAAAVRVTGMTKRFGTFAALDNVSVNVGAGSFHALLGENGAGKSTLVKCLVGFYKPDTGNIEVDGRECDVRSPHDADALGIGMVYQHFTLVPSMTVAENLVISRSDTPGLIRWGSERERIEAFLAKMPFRIPLDAPVSALAAGDKQKTEILKQLYLRRRFLILDEPTSVLTPAEADEVLGLLKEMAQRKEVSVLMITHKFREVSLYCDEVTVLRRGRNAGGGAVGDLDTTRMAEMMVGDRVPQESKETRAAVSASATCVLSVRGLHVRNDTGIGAVNGLDIECRAGEILGIAGVSGNGQRELVEAIAGQRTRVSGDITVASTRYRATRGQIRSLRVCGLPEEPLRNACVGSMSVAENMALRNFDQPPIARGPWVLSRFIVQQAEGWIRQFNVKSRGSRARIGTLSGGNVQRAVLARELSAPVSLLIAADPVFGLDFAAVAEIHDRIRAARDEGAAVLLISSDLDELFSLADRIAVIFEGRIVYEAPTARADIREIGRAMAGHTEREAA